MNQLQTQTLNKPSVWQSLYQRFSLVIRAFKAPLHATRIQLSNGTILDLSTNTVIVNGEFTLHSTGTLKLSTDRHLILMSGMTPEERAGYVHGVWLNPDLDNEGRPLKAGDTVLVLEESDIHEKH